MVVPVFFGDTAFAANKAVRSSSLQQNKRSGSIGLLISISRQIKAKIYQSIEKRPTTQCICFYFLAVICGLFITGFAFVVPFLGKFVLKVFI